MEKVYGVVDEAAHKAAGGLPVVRAAQTVIKAPIDDVAACWWQAGRRKVFKNIMCALWCTLILQLYLSVGFMPHAD